MACDPFFKFFTIKIGNCKFDNFSQVYEHSLFHFAQPFFNVASCFQTLHSQDKQITGIKAQFVISERYNFKCIKFFTSHFMCFIEDHLSERDFFSFRGQHCQNVITKNNFLFVVCINKTTHFKNY